MKQMGNPQYSLGDDIVSLGSEWKSKGVSESFFVDIYIHNAPLKLDRICGLQECKKQSILLT